MGHHISAQSAHITPQTAEYLAAIDLGTRNCRLIIAKHHGGQIEIVDLFSRFVCLGEGVAQSRRLGRKAMERTITVLKQCAKRLSHYPNVVFSGVTTDAVRRAENAQSFLRRVARETGLKLEMIDEKEEAYYEVLGCARVLDMRKKRHIIFDIGGGSSEIILCSLDQEKRVRIDEMLSLPYGVVNLYESVDKLTFTSYTSIVEEVQNLCRRFLVAHLGDLASQDVSAFQVIGTSGTTTTVAAMHHNLKMYDRERVDGTSLCFEDVQKVIHYVQSLSPAERRSNAFCGHVEDDLVLTGFAILEGILRAVPCMYFTVTDAGVRDGLIRTLAYGADATRISA